MRKRRTHLVGFAVLLALACATLCLAAPASLSGVVRDSAGDPQMGARVELLRADLSVVAVAVTDSRGRYHFDAVLPGRYAVKAVCAAFLPTLRENLHLRSGSVVNLTMSTLYEAMQWLPAEPRKPDARQDDWAWTLRSAANRPLLRWLEDGPLVVVDGGRGARRLKARLMASGGEGSFGESGERISATIEETPVGSRELLARVDFEPNSDAALESMLGFRQELGYIGAVQSMAAISIHPEITGPAGQGLAMVGMRSEETIQLGDLATIDAGATAVLARMQGSGSLHATLPSLEIRWSNGGGAQRLRYRLASETVSGDDPQLSVNLPRFALRNNRLALERGLHQEIGWERTTETTGLSLAFFSDHIENPILEASGDDGDGALVDPLSGLARYAGQNFSSTGVEASFEREIKGGNRIRLSYANGDALVMAAHSAPSVAQLVSTARPRRTQTYALTLSGTLDGTGTRWRASYRWQPDDAVTAVAPYALNAASPYLSLRLRQPVRLGSANFDALFDVQNLLAEGYRPYLMTDGSFLLFAQGQRAIRAGLAFTF